VGIFLGVAAVVFLLGGGMAFATFGDWRRRRRILDMPLSPVALSRGDSPVQIEGGIVPSEQGLVSCPLSGRPAVWYRLTVRELRSSRGGPTWHPVHTELDGRAFLIDDGSGQTARVLPGGASVLIDTNRPGASGLFTEAVPELQRFLLSRGIPSRTASGGERTLGYQEEVVAPGDRLLAIGPSRRDPQLVLFQAEPPDGDLFLTNRSPLEITSHLQSGFALGVVLAAAGLILEIVALVVTFAR
jgi:hypothetical protein